MQWFHFDIGWFNLWILSLLIFITPVLLNIARGERGKIGLRRATELPPMSQAEHFTYMLVMSQERAVAQDIIAQAIMLTGQLRAELVAVAEEINATFIVMGGSLGPDAAFENSALQVFAADLQTETGIEVRIPGSSD